MNIGIVPCYKDTKHVMQRWRYDILVKYLSQYGHNAQYYQEGKSYDIVIASIITENIDIFRRIFKRGVPIIGDITDDLLTFPYSYYSVIGQIYYRIKFALNRRNECFREMLRNSHHIVAGSEYQKKRFLVYNPNISCITDAITNDILSLQARYDNTEPYKIAWFGNVASLHGFSDMGNALDVLSSLGKYELVLITSDSVHGSYYAGSYPRTVQEFIRRQKIPCRWVPWSYDSILKETARCDIGIVPVDIKEESVMAKPSGRLLLMMGMGLPVVAGAIDSHLNAIEEGVTGFIARSPQGWVQAIRQLSDSVELRKNVGMSAAHFVKENFSEKIFAHKYLEVINNL